MDSYHVAVNGQQQGPFPADLIRSSLAHGVYTNKTQV